MSQATDMPAPTGDGIHGPLKVPVPRWKIALTLGIPTVFFSIVLSTFAATFAFAPDFKPKWSVGRGGATSRPLGQSGRYLIAAVALVPPAIFLSVLVYSLVFPYPGFAVRPDGLAIFGRKGRPPLYPWSEVDAAHWLRYDPGRLSIRLRGTELWSYRVPPAYRRAVEAAIRAHGKWQDGGPAPVASA